MDRPRRGYGRACHDHVREHGVRDHGCARPIRGRGHAHRADDHDQYDFCSAFCSSSFNGLTRVMSRIIPHQLTNEQQPIEYDDLDDSAHQNVVGCNPALPSLVQTLRLANNHRPKAITAMALPPSSTRPRRSRTDAVRAKKPSARSRRTMVQITNSRMVAIMPSAIAPVRRRPAPIMPRALAYTIIKVVSGQGTKPVAKAKARLSASVWLCECRSARMNSQMPMTMTRMALAASNAGARPTPAKVWRRTAKPASTKMIAEPTCVRIRIALVTTPLSIREGRPR